VVTLLARFMMGAARLFGRLKTPAIAKSTLGGVVFGLVGVALPVTMFSGSDQLTTVLKDAGTLAWRRCRGRSPGPAARRSGHRPGVSQMVRLAAAIAAAAKMAGRNHSDTAVRRFTGSRSPAGIG
jgi:hypothetical protein